MNQLQLLDSGLQANDKYKLYYHHRPQSTNYTIVDVIVANLHKATKSGLSLSLSLLFKC